MTTPETTAPPVPAKKSRSKLALVWLILSQIAAVLIILLTVAFGAYGVLTEGTTWTVMTYLVIYPLVDIALIVAAWIAYRKYHATVAMILTSLPVLIPVCYWAIFWGWIMLS
jgi:hypothetical protein